MSEGDKKEGTEWMYNQGQGVNQVCVKICVQNQVYVQATGCVHDSNFCTGVSSVHRDLVRIQISVADHFLTPI